MFRVWSERVSLRRFIGVSLTGISFFAAVIVPQSQSAAASLVTYIDTQNAETATLPTTSNSRWPITRFGISQNFHLGHPGIDLADPAGTPVYPVRDGKVTWIMTLPWGYGRHVVIRHSDTLESLYAHLSKISVTMGQDVTTGTKIGEVGSTGWSTGNHLHLEIRENGTPLNPREVLPEIRQEETASL